MHTEKYTLKSGRRFTRFEFISEGPKGSILKLIEFQETEYPNVFNLAFGDFNPQTQEIDDRVVSNNKDTDKVLSTVVKAVYMFFDEYPGVLIYATGSTKSRTRLYRMGISRFYPEMKKDFHLYGQIGNDFVEFKINTKYDGFLVQRKL